MIPRHLKITSVILLLAVVGGVIYGWQLHKREQRTLYASRLQRPVSAAAIGPIADAVLSLAYDQEAALRDERVRLPLPADPSERARELLRALFDRYLERSAPHQLGEGADVNAVYLLDDGRTAVVDTSIEFASGHRSGVLVESLTIASMLATLHKNFPEVERVLILVEGQPRATLAGHADISFAIEVSPAVEMARQVQ